MEFPGFLGNEPVKQAIRAGFSAGRFPHAVILQGEPGTGRHTLARLLAQALVCRNPAHAPCGECPSCVRARAGSHPDIRVVEGGGVSGTLTVDAVREMTADASRMPEEADCNVYIVYLGENTLPAAQNKLLKLIEEPPQGTVFLMICKNAQSLLATVRSRAQIYTLIPPPIPQAAKWLAEHTGASPERARELAMLCGGNLGLMQAEAQDGGAGRAFAIAGEMAEAMFAAGGHRLLKAAAPLQKDRKLFAQTLARLTMIFRDACVLKCGGESQLGGAPELAGRLCALPMKRLARLPEVTEEYRQKLQRNANGALLVTCLCVELRSS